MSLKNNDLSQKQQVIFFLFSHAISRTELLLYKANVQRAVRACRMENTSQASVL